MDKKQLKLNITELMIMPEVLRFARNVEQTYMDKMTDDELGDMFISLGKFIKTPSKE